MFVALFCETDFSFNSEAACQVANDLQGLNLGRLHNPYTDEADAKRRTINRCNWKGGAKNPGRIVGYLTMEKS